MLLEIAPGINLLRNDHYRTHFPGKLGRKSMFIIRALSLTEAPFARWISLRMLRQT